MSDCLFLCHRLPYPPNKGDKIRAYQWLLALAERHRVHLGAFVDDPADWQYQSKLAGICHSLYLRPLPRLRARVRSLSGFWQREALSFGYYRDRAMADFVRQTLAAEPVDRVLVYSSTMGPYVEFADSVRRVMDFVDVDSDKWRQYAASTHGPMRFVYAREAERLAAGESRLAATFDASVLVSQAELDLFTRTMPSRCGRLRAIDNGVDTDYFDPAIVERPADPGEGTDRIVFTGTMDYTPNVDAVTWFAKSVLPAVRLQRPEARFAIVGARPSPAVRDLARLSGVEVVGAVDDIRPYIAEAAVVVAPMRVARGVQNKVLEALAMGRPVVMTMAAQLGLDTPPALVGAVADNPVEFAEKVVEMLNRSTWDEVADQARHYVLARYRWSDRTRKLLDVLEPPAMQPGYHAA